ncbi:hypothetical protein KY335_01760 [Candidatus Woesearchaeota archaeon]|nr:hypothetical protein [Candidatus Woesearchaeota archaeon]
MKTVFIAGSRKFYDKIVNLISELKKRDISADKAEDWDKTQKDTFESEKKALFAAFEKIDDADIVYIFADNGYIGKTVAIEIAYAYAKGKEVVSSEELEELSARTLISKVMSPEELIEYCK